MEYLNYLKWLFQKCLNAKYIHVENDGDYAVERDGDTLYLLFQWSNGEEDWKNNFDFFAKPYHDMDVTWRCHRGFLRVWKSIRPYIAEYVADPSVKKIVVCGYSHGAAIATLAHEYVWFERPDLRTNFENADKVCLEGYGFGCPRVFWGHMPKKLKERWLTFIPIRNLNDIVTHVPPVLFGFRHVAEVFEIGHKGRLNRHRKLDCVSAHYPDNYELSLTAFDKEEEK